MNNLKYWYIDDENGSPERATVSRFKHHNVNVELFNLEHSRDFGTLKSEIIKLSKEECFGGLILDLRLDGNGDYPTSFNATALAQELRSVSGRGETLLYPIVLTSSMANIKETYNNDKTSHDLFDYKIYKTSEDWAKKSLKLNALAKGYKTINSTFSKNEKIKKPHLKSLDDKLEAILDKKSSEINNDKLKDKLLGLVEQEDKHLITHFIIKEMFHFTNPFLSKRVLFAKLGLYFDDIPLSDRDKIYEFLDSAKYTGIFSTGWDRWWNQDFENIIQEAFGIRFGLIPATQRVNILNEHLNIELKAAENIQYTFSNIYSTVCEATKRPIDHLEGFKVKTSHDYLPWQTPKYMSLYAILERINRDKVTPHFSEKSRIDEEKLVLKEINN